MDTKKETYNISLKIRPFNIDFGVWVHGCLPELDCQLIVTFFLLALTNIEFAFINTPNHMIDTKLKLYLTLNLYLTVQTSQTKKHQEPRRHSLSHVLSWPLRQCEKALRGTIYTISTLCHHPADHGQRSLCGHDFCVLCATGNRPLHSATASPASEGTIPTLSLLSSDSLSRFQHGVSLCQDPSLPANWSRTSKMGAKSQTPNLGPCELIKISRSGACVIHPCDLFIGSTSFI